MSAMSFGSKKRSGFKIPEARLCPTCWNAMKEVGKGVWDCAKHGDPRAWENRNLKRRKVEPKPVPIVKVGGLPEELKKFVPAPEVRRRLTPELKAYVLACAAQGESANHVADRIWKDLGYKNAEAAKGTFYRTLRARDNR